MSSARSPSKQARDRKRAAAHHRKIVREKNTPTVQRAGAISSYAAANTLVCFKCKRSDRTWAMSGTVRETGHKWVVCTSCADASKRKKKKPSG